MQIEEDNFFGHSRKDMGFQKTDNYPLLLIDSSSAEMPPAELSEKDAILTFLFNNGLIGSYKTYSAFEKQGLEFVEKEFKPALDDLFRDFRPLV